MMRNPKIETLFRDERAALQRPRLQWSVKHAYDPVPMYREKMQKAGVKPDDIRALAVIRYISPAFKQELREQDPFQRVAVPLKDIVRIHASSGTPGQPAIR